jgi:hypothetical protein
MIYNLHSVENPALGVQLGNAPILVGRSRENHIKLYDQASSRRHAQISLVNGEPVVTDLNSAQGTFVNHRRVSQSILRAGDVVAFGRQQFRVELLGNQPAAAGMIAPSAPSPYLPQMQNYPGRTVSMEERNAILEREIVMYARQGWRVTGKGMASAQMTRDKQASLLLAFVLGLFFLVPAILYLLLYRGSENLFLEVDERGIAQAIRG